MDSNLSSKRVVDLAFVSSFMELKQLVGRRQTPRQMGFKQIMNRSDGNFTGTSNKILYA